MGDSFSERAPSGRIEIIDFLRGFAILEMIITHYQQYYPLTLNKLVSYTETAMPLFLLLSGFMIGMHYFPRYLRDPRGTTRRLWRRALQILVIQYIIIATVNIPLYLTGSGEISGSEPLLQFVLRSAAFMNQIGIIHILPTFIPLLLASPFMLYLFANRLGWVVIAASAGLFALGHFSPHILDWGNPVIFPVIVVQIYFVAGCVWGRAAHGRDRIGPRGLTGWLVASLAALAVTMTLYHGKIVPGRIISTHPLNLFGLIYHAPIITTILLGAMRFSRLLEGTFLYRWICLYGRHALLAFVVHLYWAKAVNVLNAFVGIPPVLNYLLLLANLALGLLVVHRYERHDRTDPPPWARVLDALFR